MTGAGYTVSENTFDAVAPAASLAVIVTENVPAAFGVPEMTPPELMVRPIVDNPLAVHVNGEVPPAAAIVGAL